MGKPNRLDIARATGELAPATKESVAEALGVEVGSEQFEKAFEKAAERGLVEQQATDGADAWTLSTKGRRKLEAQTAGD